MRLPELTVTCSWRELYEAGTFAQRELASDTSFRSAASDRGTRLGVGHAQLEQLDLQGALRPIAFALGGYWSGFEVPAVPSDSMVFSEDISPQAWSAYEWTREGEIDYPVVSAMYSGWQLLYAGRWSEGADEAWRPTLKTLVALQNHYWPRVTGTENVIPRPDGGWVVAGPDPGDFDPQAVLTLLGARLDELLALYQEFVFEAVRRDPQDGLTLLRRARPKPFQLRWKGAPVRAQDCFDAADVLWRFLSDLNGSPPEAPDWDLMDGRQPERKALFSLGPSSTWAPEQTKALLLEAQLYPPGVHVIGEGRSEKLMVEALVDVLAGPMLLDKIGFHDLGGSGSAAQVAPLAEAFKSYAAGVAVIVDREGQMAEYLTTATDEGRLDPADVLLFDDSLEADTATSAELIEVALGIGRQVESNPIEFELEPGELDAFHEDRRGRANRKNPPGKADSLLVLVGRKSNGRLRIDKLQFVDALAVALAKEIADANAEDLEEIRTRRRLVDFVIRRVIGPLVQPVPLGRQI